MISIAFVRYFCTCWMIKLANTIVLGCSKLSDPHREIIRSCTSHFRLLASNSAAAAAGATSATAAAAGDAELDAVNVAADDVVPHNGLTYMVPVLCWMQVQQVLEASQGPTAAE